MVGQPGHSLRKTSGWGRGAGPHVPAYSDRPSELAPASMILHGLAARSCDRRRLSCARRGPSFSLYDLFVVSEDQIQKWATEAEAGYDVANVKRRGRGRPGRGAETMQVVDVRLTAEELEALDAAAERDDLSRSEAIRAALAHYAGEDPRQACTQAVQRAAPEAVQPRPARSPNSTQPRSVCRQSGPVLRAAGAQTAPNSREIMHVSCTVTSDEARRQVNLPSQMAFQRGGRRGTRTPDPLLVREVL